MTTPTFLLAPSTINSEDIKRLREELSLRQLDLAKLMGLSWQSISRAENGHNGLSAAAWAIFLLSTDRHPTHKIVSR